VGQRLPGAAAGVEVAGGNQSREEAETKIRKRARQAGVESTSRDPERQARRHGAAPVAVTQYV